MKKIFIAALTCLILPSALLAQTGDVRTEATKIADLLALQPAETADKLQDAYAQLDRFSAENIAALLAQLTPPGKGDNARIEYATNSYSFHVLLAGKESQRAKFVQGLIQVLDRLADKDNKAFVVTLLQQSGKDDAVPALSRLLPDAYLGEKAANALATIKTPVSGKALLLALPGLAGKSRTAVVQALGYVGVKEAEKAILALAGTGDNAFQKTVLFALANIAGPASEDVLAGAAREAGYVYETSNATAAYLRYAFNLAKQGNNEAAAAIGQALFDAASGETQLHTRIAALQLLNTVHGDRQVGDLVQAARNENREYRNAALGFLKPHLTAASVAQLQKKWKKNDENTQVDLLRFFGETGSTAALPLVKKSLKSKSDTLKTAAVKTYARLAGEAAVPELLKVLKDSSPEVAAAVQREFLSATGRQLVPALIAALPKAGPSEQVILTEVLGARAATASTPAVTPLLSSSHPEVQAAAYRALPQVVTSADLNQLLDLLPGAGKHTAQVQSAVTAAVNSSSDKAADIRTIISRLDKADNADKLHYFRILAGLGGADALSAVTSYIGKEPTLHAAAVRALAAWNGGEALPSLIAQSRAANEADLQDAVIKGIVRLNGQDAPLSDDQKVLNLRDAFAVAQTADQKKLILRSLEFAKTYPALLFAGNFLDDKELQQTAANTVMNIALADKSFYGQDVKRLLSRVLEVLTGSESGYLREAIQKHLAEMPKGAGYVSLFNGKDLSGWKGLVENPVKRAGMDVKTLTEKQHKADEVMRTGWKVQNGELVFTGKGDNIVAQKHYGDFEMLVDWKLDKEGKDGDAGVYLRGTPQVQIWDTSRVKVGAQVGSGGLYNNKKHESKPLKVADNQLGEWNTFKITMIGDKVTVYLNGELVTDNVVLENFWDRSQPIFPVEQLELQAHGTVVYYRDIYVREIPRKEVFKLSAEEEKEGFNVLFDGTNLDHWTGNTDAYVVSEEGTLAIFPTKGSGGNLYSKEEYGDFVYRFSFRLTPGANNGIGIRAPLTGNAAYEGTEIQVLDNTADIYKKLEVYQYHGSAYGIIAAKRGFLKPVGEWNEQEIYLKGDKIRVTLNGTVIMDGDLAKASKNGTLDGKDHPGLKRKSGHIGFLGHGSEVHFKDIRIKRL